MIIHWKNYHLSPHSMVVSLYIYIGIFILNVLTSPNGGFVDSRYIDSCSLGLELVEFRFDAEEHIFKEIITSDTDTDTLDVDASSISDDSNNSDIDVVNGAGGRRRRNRRRATTEVANHYQQLRQKNLSYKIQTLSTVPSTSPDNQNNDNNDTILARECPCGSQHRSSSQHRSRVYCPIQNGENSCRVPNSTDEPVQCYQTSIYQTFISSSWPLALLWLLALMIYLVVTEGGRSTIKYALSRLCRTSCCGDCEVFSNNRTIDGIIVREAAMRELIQMARITHVGGQMRLQHEQELEREGRPVTYILKTRAYNDGNGTKKKAASQDHLASSPSSSPSTDTIATTPDTHPSSSSSFPFEDSPRIDQSCSNEDADNNTGSPYLLSSPSSSTSLPIASNMLHMQPSSPSPSPGIDENDNKNIVHSTPPHKMNHDNMNYIENNHSCRDRNASNDYNYGGTEEGSDEEEREEEEEITCTICMVEIINGDRIGVLSCEHLFHADCLKEWIKRRNVCPLCQAPDIAEERSPPRPPTTTTNAGVDTAPRIIHPNRFILRTTGSIEMAHRSRIRTRRSYYNSDQISVSLNGSGGHGQSRVSRQLFQVNGNHGRSSPMSSRRVSARTNPVVNIGRRSGADNGNVARRQLQILVGDAASARPSSNIHRTMNSLSMTNQQQQQQQQRGQERVTSTFHRSFSD